MHSQETVHSIAGAWGRAEAYVLTDSWRKSFEERVGTRKEGERLREKRVHPMEVQPFKGATPQTKLLPDVARLRSVYMDMTGAEDFPLRLERTRSRAVWSDLTLIPLNSDLAHRLDG